MNIRMAIMAAVISSTAVFIHTIIANRNKKNISRDDAINLLIDVQMKGESMDSTSVISPLPEYDF